MYSLQAKYILKFCIDGAVLTNSRGAVQATVKIIDVDENGHPLRESNLPDHLQKEICVYYFIGIVISVTACKRKRVYFTNLMHL